MILLITNRKSYVCFRLGSASVILNDLERKFPECIAQYRWMVVFMRYLGSLLFLNVHSFVLNVVSY